MSKLLYNHPEDNLAPLATITATGFAPLAAFPLVNLTNLNPVLPAKFDDPSGQIVIDHGSAKTVKLVALIHHNLDAALQVRFQAHATNAWGAPTFDTTFTIGAKDKEGYRPNTYLDLSAAPPNLRWNRISIVGVNSLDVILGELWIGSEARTVTHNYSWGFQRTDIRPGRQSFETRAGVEWVSPSIGRRRCLEGEILDTDAGLAALSTWSQATGGMDQPTLVIPNAPDITDAMLAKWMVDFGYQGEFKDNDNVPVGWREMARALPWP